MGKKLFRGVLLILISTTLSASTYFDDGIDLFSSGNYKESFQIFSKLSEDRNFEANLDFYLGRSAFEIGEFNEALFAFDRVLIETDERDSNKINRVKLELAKTHLALGEKETAKKLFQEVLDASPPEIVKDRILSILNSETKEKPQRKEWNLFADIEVGYENNINAQPSNETMRAYINNPNVKFNDTLGSLYIQERVNIGYSHLFENKLFLFKANLFGYNQNYIEDSDYDISYLSFGITPVYKQESYKVELPVKVEYVKYAGEELLKAYSFGLKSSKFIETKFIKAIMFNIFTDYQIKDYTDRNSKQDSTTFKYGLSVITKYQNHRFNLKYSTEYEEVDNTITNIYANQTDKIINSIFVKYDVAQISNLFDLSLSYSFRNIVYDNYEAFSQGSPKISNGCRKDRYNSFKIGLSKNILMKNLNANIGFNYIHNSSNHIPAEYTNFISSLGVSYIF